MILFVEVDDGFVEDVLCFGGVFLFVDFDLFVGFEVFVVFEEVCDFFFCVFGDVVDVLDVGLLWVF